ncbi:MAG: type II CAAX endopeptidase family protein [Acutalibacteraceae bacterium]|nr:type II CAAX endopeptidase family protein [Acutalibacteraceae bacterium]
MKKIFKSIGKALTYLLVYFGVYGLISGVLVAVLSFSLITEEKQTGRELDYNSFSIQLEEKLSDYLILGTLISGVLTLVIISIVFSIRKKNVLEELNLFKFKTVGVIPIALLGAGFNVFISILFSLIPFPEAWLSSYVDNSSNVTQGGIVSLLTAVIVAPVVEEVIFRGLVYTRLKNGFSLVLSAVISSVVFGVMHSTIIWAMYTFVLGLILIWVFEKFQSLFACIILHTAFNAMGMVLSLLPELPDVFGWIFLIMGFLLILISCLWINNITKNKNNTNRIEKI